MHLSRIRLENIRAFEEFELEFVSSGGRPRSWSLLLGDNATGKTTILRSIAIGLNDPSSAAGLVKELKGSLVRQGADLGLIFCEISDGERTWTTQTTILPLTRTGDFVRQSHFEKPLDAVLAKRSSTTSSVGKSVLPSTTSTDGEDALQRLKDFPWSRLFVVGYGAGRTTDGRDEFDDYRTVDAVYTLFRYDQPLQSPELAWRRALDRARSKPRREKVDIRIRKLLRDALLLEAPDDIELTADHIAVTKNQRTTALSVSADGYKATATWVLDFLAWHLLYSKLASGYSPRGILLLDEIEQHLHPKWQRYFVTQMKKALPGVQFIGTTHSALCAAGAADLTEDDGAIFRTLFDSQSGSIVREDIPLPRGLKADQILTSEAFGLPDTRNPDLGEKIVEYRNLVRKPTRTDKEERRLGRLRRELRQKVPSAAQFEDERRLRDELLYLTEELRRLRGDGKVGDR